MDDNNKASLSPPINPCSTNAACSMQRLLLLMLLGANHAIETGRLFTRRLRLKHAVQRKQCGQHL